MNATGYRDRAERFAARLVVQSAWPVVLIAAVAVAALLRTAPLAAPAPSPLVRIATLVAVASGIVALALSMLVLFDALLFRLIAGHESEAMGTAAVDDLLMRLRLKSVPAINRPLAERIAGARRLLLRQRLALAVFIASALVARGVIGIGR
jgi:hypothetical protein